MLRSLGTLLFIIIYLHGYFQNIPSLVLLLLIIICFLEDISIYMIYYNKNPSKIYQHWRKMSFLFFHADDPDFKTRPILFSVDRLGYAVVISFLIYYLLFKYPFPYSLN